MFEPWDLWENCYFLFSWWDTGRKGFWVYFWVEMIDGVELEILLVHQKITYSSTTIFHQKWNERNPSSKHFSSGRCVILHVINCTWCLCLPIFHRTQLNKYLSSHNALLFSVYRGGVLVFIFTFVTKFKMLILTNFHKVYSFLIENRFMIKIFKRNAFSSFQKYLGFCKKIRDLPCFWKDDPNLAVF